MTTAAAASLADLGYQEEDLGFGNGVSTPNLKTFRRISGAPSLSKEAYDSEERRKDRMQADSRHGRRSVAGAIETEASVTSYDAAWEAVLGGAWAAGVTVTASAGDGITATAATRTFTRAAGGGQSFITDGLRIGDRVQIAGLNAAYDGKAFTITGLTATTMTVAPEPGVTFVDVSTADVDATITVLGKKLTIGNAFRSFVMERAWTDIGQFQAFKGCVFNSVNVSLPTTGMARLSWNVIGKDADSMSASSIDGAAALTRTATELGSLTISGKTITCGTSDWATQGIAVGNVITLSDVTGISGFPEKQLTVTSVNATALSVAEAIPNGTATAYTLTRVGQPSYAAPETTSSLVAVNGVMLMDGQPVAVITEFSFSVDNQMGGKPVVGSNTVPFLKFGNRQMVQGSVSFLFTDSTVYNKFVNEQEVSLLLRMDDPDGGFLSWFFQRVKLNGGEINDSDADGLPISMEFRSLAPQDTTATDNSHIVMQAFAG